jgi:two-component system response regulator (stage 0 sporulation protein F)
MANVLIVDDEEGVRETLGNLISAGGHTVWQATSGFEAINSFNAVDADLAIVDLIMPELGGLETIAELRKTNPKLKVIAVSGAPKMGRCRLLEWATRMGADRTFSKPFVMSEILGAVGEILSAPQTRPVPS